MLASQKNSFRFRCIHVFNVVAYASVVGFGAICLSGTLRAQLTSDRTETPLNQVLTPAGYKIDLPGMRPQVLSITPNGKWLIKIGRASCRERVSVLV